MCVFVGAINHDAYCILGAFMEISAITPTNTDVCMNAAMCVSNKHRSD